MLRLIAQRQQEARRDLQNAETLLQREMKDRLAADKRNLAVKSADSGDFPQLKKNQRWFWFITDGDGKRLVTVGTGSTWKPDHSPCERRTDRSDPVNNVENYDIRTSGQEKLSQ